MRVIIERPELLALGLVGGLAVAVALLSALLEAGCKALWRAVTR